MKFYRIKETTKLIQSGNPEDTCILRHHDNRIALAAALPLPQGFAPAMIVGNHAYEFEGIIRDADIDAIAHARRWIDGGNDLHYHIPHYTTDPRHHGGMDLKATIAAIIASESKAS